MAFHRPLKKAANNSSSSSSSGENDNNQKETTQNLPVLRRGRRLPLLLLLLRLLLLLLLLLPPLLRQLRHKDKHQEYESKSHAVANTSAIVCTLHPGMVRVLTLLLVAVHLFLRIVNM